MPTPEEILALTEEIEERKAEKQRAREEKAEEKRRKKRSEQIEKLAAPFILLITVVVGLVLWSIY